MSPAETSNKGKPAPPANDPAGSPPQLKTNFWRGVKTLALINILPILGLIYLGIGWYRGTIQIRSDVGSQQIVIIAFVVIACTVIALSSWLVMPTARWMRDFPAWHFRHRSRVAWFLPMIAGAISWFVLMAIGISACLVSAYVIASGAWKMAQPYFAGHGA
jgi:hypothetical protein